MEDLVAGMEMGVLMPRGYGEEEAKRWVERFGEEIERRADMGEVWMVALRKEVRRGVGSGPVWRR